LNYKRFQENLPKLLHSDEGDVEFQVLWTLFTGLASPRVAQLLNYACQCFEGQDLYVEIGSFTGFTLISAGYRNNAPVIGIEDFSSKILYTSEDAKKKAKNDLYQNIEKYGSDHCIVVEKDFRNVDFENKRIAVLFIDGEHDYKNVDDALIWVDPFLADNAIVVCDDIRISGVYKRVIEAVGSGVYRLLYFCNSSILKQDELYHKGKITDRFVGNGFAVLQRTIS